MVPPSRGVAPRGADRPGSVYEGVANVIAAVMLLLEFGMLRQALVRDQVRLYAAQSALISVLAVAAPPRQHRPRNCERPYDEPLRRTQVRIARRALAPARPLCAFACARNTGHRAGGGRKGLRMV